MENMVKTADGRVEPETAKKLLRGVLPEKRVEGPSRRKEVMIGGVLLAAAVAGGFVAANRGWVSTDDAFIEGHVVAVSPRVKGRVLRVLVEDNQFVKKGDLLAELDPRDFVNKADDARAEVEGARAVARKTSLDVRRFEALLARNEASRQTRDHAAADAEAAVAALHSAEARLRQAELDLSYTRVEAPQAGRVTRKTVEEGAHVEVGQSLLAIVPEEVWVVANFKETQLRKMRPGQRAEISIDAYPGKLVGRVDSLQAGTGARFSVLPAENATGNFVKVVQRLPVKIVLDNPSDARRLLAPGMSVGAEIEVK